MDNHPESKEQLSEEGTPRLIAVVDGIGNASHNTDEVDDQQCGRGDQKRCPLDGIQLAKIVVFS